MTHAIVLIQAEGSALATLGGELAGIEGVAEAYSVTGEWDFVAILRLREQDMLAQVVTGKLSQLAGVRRTQTMVAFEVYSRHDLEALFSIGQCLTTPARGRRRRPSPRRCTAAPLAGLPRPVARAAPGHAPLDRSI